MRVAASKLTVGAPRTPGALATSPPLADHARVGFGRVIGSLRSGATSTASDFVDLLSSIGSRGGVEEPAMPVPLPGSRTLPVPLLIGIALDESGSTSSSDPNKESHKACLLVCEWLATCSQNPEDGLGLVRFADRAETLPPVRADKAHDALEHAFRIGASVGGGTQLTPAIVQLCQLLPGPRRERRLALLITDGQVAEHGDQLRALIGRLRVEADAVYLLALDHDGAWSRSTNRRYEGLGLTGMLPIGRLTGGRLAHAIASVLVHEAGLDTTR